MACMLECMHACSSACMRARLPAAVSPRCSCDDAIGTRMQYGQQLPLPGLQRMCVPCWHGTVHHLHTPRAPCVRRPLRLLDAPPNPAPGRLGAAWCGALARTCACWPTAAASTRPWRPRRCWRPMASAPRSWTRASASRSTQSSSARCVRCCCCSRCCCYMCRAVARARAVQGLRARLRGVVSGGAQTLGGRGEKGAVTCMQAQLPCLLSLSVTRALARKGAMPPYGMSSARGLPCGPLAHCCCSCLQHCACRQQKDLSQWWQSDTRSNYSKACIARCRS